MNNIRDKFEAWFTGEVDSKTRRAMMEKDDAGYYKFQSAYNAWNVWQAATEQSQKEIEALKAREKALVEALEACKYDCNTGEIIGIARDALANVRGE